MLAVMKPIPLSTSRLMAKFTAMLLSWPMVYSVSCSVFIQAMCSEEYESAEREYKFKVYTISSGTDYFFL